MKTRVWELAKNLGVRSKLLLEIAKESNFNITSALSSLDKEQIAVLRGAVERKRSKGNKKTANRAVKESSDFDSRSSTPPPSTKAREEKKQAERPSEPKAPKEEVEHKNKNTCEEKIAPTHKFSHKDKDERKDKSQSVQKDKETHVDEHKDKSKGEHKGYHKDKNKVESNNRIQNKEKSEYRHKANKEKIKYRGREKSQSQERQNQKPATPPKTYEKKPQPPVQDKQQVNTTVKNAQLQKKQTFPHKHQTTRTDKFKKSRAKFSADRETRRKNQYSKKTPKYQSSQTVTPVVCKTKRKIELHVPISVKEFSQLIGVRANLIIQKLLESFKVKLNLTGSLDETMVEWIGLEFGKDIQIKKGEDREATIIRELEKKDAPEDLGPRAPIVTFMGHVDHGKTSLLDKIRKTNVTAQESGGITQHIGAYKIHHNNQPIVFLDTPGHEAFTAMRARGANVTDIVVLVVAADDGVMPQTIEAINHAKAAEVPIVVAINKIDRPNAKPELAMQQLSQQGLIPEEWHGDTVCVKVSAMTGAGIPDLLEYLALVAEMQELKANPKKKALGVVLESKIMEHKGVVATLLVQDGHLRKGDTILCGTGHGRIREIINHTGKRIREAGPSTPVEICGLSELPEAGDRFYVLENVSMARTFAEDRKKKLREKSLAKGTRKLSLEEIMRQIQQGETQELRVVLKVDVHGSLEAISAKLDQISTEEIKVKLLHAAVGGINERDIQLANASQALVIGFNVTASKVARDMADDKHIEIRTYNIIYQLLDDVKQIMTGMLIPEDKEEITGHATIRKVIRISKIGNIAGCYITGGAIERNSKVRISRNGVVLNKEKPLELSSLRRFKEDVPKVKEGFECGIRLDGFDDIKEGDEIEAFKIISVAKTLK